MGAIAMGYFGSKTTSGLCQAIIAMMPPHDTYIESHLGGGAIMKRKPPALRSIGIDRDPQTIADFECSYPVELIIGCGQQFLANYDYQGSELVYSDPPYLLASRTSGRRYRFDYDQRDHIELLELLKRLPCRVILSGYPSTLYDDLLQGWRSLELQVMNRGGVRTEKLWMNFSGDRLYWAGYAGKNFTDRQRIKRKAATWARRYQALPPGERLAVLSAMMAIEVRETSPCGPILYPADKQIMSSVNKQSLREEHKNASKPSSQTHGDDTAVGRSDVKGIRWISGEEEGLSRDSWTITRTEA